TGRRLGRREQDHELHVRRAPVELGLVDDVDLVLLLLLEVGGRAPVAAVLLTIVDDLEQVDHLFVRERAVRQAGRRRREEKEGGGDGSQWDSHDHSTSSFVKGFNRSAAWRRRGAG